MKKIIPFKKDIIFKTNISEITSISLEHDLKIDENSLVGNFIVSGEYKITDTSSNIEKFLYELPFKIVFDDKYILKNVTIDINDFYYEIINNSVLSVNIETEVDKIEEVLIENKIEENIKLGNKDDNIIENRCIEEENEQINNNENIEKRNIEDSINLFDNINIEETYNTYKIYIVRENDSLQTIMEKYKIDKELLEMYNDINEIKIGDKIVIPVIYEGN